MKFHPPTQESTVLAVEECVAPDGDFPTCPYLASADFAAWRMTRRSLGCCSPNRISADWRSRVWLLGTTGLPVGLHFGKKKMLQNRKTLWDLPKPQAIREYVLEQLPHSDL